MGIVSSAIERVDGWFNETLGVGDRSTRRDFRFASHGPLDFQTLEALYHEDAYAAIICDAKPTDALRQGFAVRTGDPGLDSAVAVSMTDLDVSARILETAIWGNVYGGALLFAGANDDRDPAEPLDWKGIRSLHFLTSVDRWEAIPRKWFGDPLTVTYGEPSQYMFQRVATGGGMVDVESVHASRVIRFNGNPTSRRRRARNAGWHESVLQRTYDPLQKFNSAAEALVMLLLDSSQTVIKINGLAAAFARDKSDVMKRRIEQMNSMRSLARAVLIDSEKEDVTKLESGALTGVADVFERAAKVLAGAARIPITRIFRQSPAGLNATGESDTRGWYEEVGAYQEQVILPRAERVVRMVLRAKDGPTGGKEPKNWRVVFPPLWQMTPVEQATVRKTIAETDGILIDKQIITPEEAALSHFRREGFNADISISLEAREALVAADAGAVKPGDIDALGGDGTTQLGAGDGAPAVADPVSPADTAMNGTQTVAMIAILKEAAVGSIPRESSQRALMRAFAMSAQDADDLLATIGRGFTPGDAPPAVAP